MVFLRRHLSCSVYCFQYTINNTFCDRGENGVSLLGITGYVIVQVDGKYVMLEMMLSAAPFGDVKHTGDAILCTSKHELVGSGVGKYEAYYSCRQGDCEG